jgi:hypothetical protein
MAPSASLARFRNFPIASLSAVVVVITEVVTPRKGFLAEDAGVWLDAGVAEMMTFQVINAGEPPLTDGAAEVFAGGGLHGETRLGW